MQYLPISPEPSPTRLSTFELKGLGATVCRVKVVELSGAKTEFSPAESFLVFFVGEETWFEHADRNRNEAVQTTAMIERKCMKPLRRTTVKLSPGCNTLLK